MQSSITKSSFLFMYLHLYFPFLIEFGVKKTHVKGIGTASLLWHTRPWKGLLLLSLSHLPFATLFLPCLGFPCGSAGKEYACNVGDVGSIPGLGRSPGEGKGSVQFSRSVVSESLRPQGLQHTRPPCPSPTPGVYPNSAPLSQWCHPTISSLVVPFSSHLQSFPASGSFPISQFFATRSQSIEVSASASVPPMNTQDWSPLGWSGWIFLQSEGLSKVFSNNTV